MQMDFHYYATYCAAVIAGYSHEEALTICYSDQFVDDCTKTVLSELKAPLSAASSQLQLELMDAKTDVLGLQDITRIWASFHFLPYDLNKDIKMRTKRYKNKYRLICNSNSDLMLETVKLAKGASLQAAGVAMHVLADTWAHRYFAGTPSLVINDTSDYFYEQRDEDGIPVWKKIAFRHSVSAPDDIENSRYTNSLFQPNENSIMNLGHGRAGHLPDYSFAKYKYLPAWGGYEEIIKDNPSDYMHAFGQMIRAMRYLRGDIAEFGKEEYDFDFFSEYADEIDAIFRKRQPDDCADFKALGERLSGQMIPDYDVKRYWQEYCQADKEKKDDTFLGKFFLATLGQKSMVTRNIYKSGNILAGFSVDINGKGFKGIRDYRLLMNFVGGKKDDGISKN